MCSGLALTHVLTSHAGFAQILEKCLLCPHLETTANRLISYLAGGRLPSVPKEELEGGRGRTPEEQAVPRFQPPLQVWRARPPKGPLPRPRSDERVRR